MKRSITDIHMHIIPGVDDGAIDFKMSLEMIEEAYKQGVRNIFCTSHNVYEKEDIERYKSKFFMLKKMSESLYHDLNLFMGCELLCAGEYMEILLHFYNVKNQIESQRELPQNKHVREYADIASLPEMQLLYKLDNFLSDLPKFPLPPCGVILPISQQKAIRLFTKKVLMKRHGRISISITRVKTMLFRRIISKENA